MVEFGEREDGQSLKDLVVWQRAIQLSLAVYRLTPEFPKTEQFSLTDQVRRTGVSVASNIAESTGRTTRGEFESIPDREFRSEHMRRLNLVRANKGGRPAVMSPCPKYG